MNKLEQLIKEEIESFLNENRTLGNKLSDKEGSKIVSVYRAVDEDVNSFKDKDYVTLSREFAVVHAEHGVVADYEPNQVIMAEISTEDLYETGGNANEYFYSGPELEGKVIYKTKGIEDFEGYDELTSDDFLAEVNVSWIKEEMESFLKEYGSFRNEIFEVYGENTDSFLEEGATSLISLLKKYVFNKKEKLKKSIVDFKKGVKREKWETILASKYFLKIISGKGDSLTPEEIKFLKDQSIDLARVVALLGLQVIPGASTGRMVMLLVIRKLNKFFKKKGINFEIKLPVKLSRDSHEKSGNLDVLQKAYPDKELAESIKERISKIEEELNRLDNE